MLVMDALRLEYPTRIDRRVVIARIRMLENPCKRKQIVAIQWNNLSQDSRVSVCGIC